MAAAKELLEFHAKRPWRPEEAVEDPDEKGEDNTSEAENGFSLEEVLRLGGTKVTAAGSGERDQAWRVPQVARLTAPPLPRCVERGRPGLRSQPLKHVFGALPTLVSTAVYKRKVSN